MYTATKYKVTALDKHCEKFLMKSITDDNVQEILAISDTYKLPALRRMCKLFISKANPDIPATWVRFDPNRFPEGAVVAGYTAEGLPICIGRCIYEGNILPGAVDFTDETITVTHEGQVIKLKNFEIFLNGNLYWSRSSQNMLSDAVSGGTTELGETVYVGRAMHEGVLKIGKVSPVSDKLYVPYGSREIKLDGPYEVLIEKTTNRIC